jgi:RNA polymerase sigma factor (sigma-70 family)
VGPELRTLFEAGTVIGRSDGELVDRFLAAGGPAAELAFAALVERHGALVWRVCREVLRESNDAADAFQATFLVLARRAGAIRRRWSLGPWLYGVARRVARCARSRAARRRNREQAAAEQKREKSVAEVDRLDAAPIIHEEVVRLPEEYRAALVLCYFEGLTHDRAASQLGWPVGTVRSRLAEARDRLRPRLLRRGVAPSVAILAATGRAEAAASVPAALVAATVGMAVRGGAAGTVPVVAAALVGTALRETTIMKRSMIATGLVAAALVGAAGVLFVAARPQNAGKAVTPAQNDPAAKSYVEEAVTPAQNEPAAKSYVEKAVTRAQNDPAAKALAEGSNPTAIELGRDRRIGLGSNIGPGTNSARVLWAELNAADLSLQLANAAHAAGGGGVDRVAASRGEVEALAAELNACADDLRDEVDLLQIQREIRKADVQAVEAQLAKAIESHKVNENLDKNKGVISQAELRNSQRDVEIRSAELAKRQAELNEVMLRIKQATRRRNEAIALAERAKELVAKQDAPHPPADPAPKR